MLIYVYSFSLTHITTKPWCKQDLGGVQPEDAGPPVNHSFFSNNFFNSMTVSSISEEISLKTLALTYISFLLFFLALFLSSYKLLFLFISRRRSAWRLWPLPTCRLRSTRSCRPPAPPRPTYHNSMRLIIVICIYIYIHIYIHTHYKSIHTYTHIHTYIHTHIHTYIHACIHTYIHTYMHTNTYTYIYIYILHICYM